MADKVNKISEEHLILNILNNMVIQAEVGNVQVQDSEILFENKGKPVSIQIENVIRCHAPEAEQGFFNKIFKNQPNLVLQYMSPGKGFKWTVEVIHISGDNSKCDSLMSDVNGKLKQATETKRPKKLSVFINPIGGSQNAKSIYANIVEPLFKAAGISCDVMISERAKHMVELISAYKLEDTDGIVVLGGDGTLLEILNCLIPRIQEEAGVDYNQSTCALKKTSVPIGIIPTGTGNGASEALYGVQDHVTATLHIIKGKTDYNNIQGVYSGGKLLSYSAVVVAHGLFSDMMHYTDQQRWMKKMRYVVMPIHTALIREKRLFNAKCTIISRKTPEEDDIEDAASCLQEETQEMDGTFFIIVSWGASKKYCGPFGASIADLMIHPKDFVLTTFSNTNFLQFLKFFKDVGLKKADCVEGRYMAMMSFWGDFNVHPFMDYCRMVKHMRETGSFSLLAYTLTNGPNILSHLFKVQQRNESGFQRDFLTNYSTVGYKVKIIVDDQKNIDPQSTKAKLQRLLDVDGEMFEFQNGEYEIRGHGPVVKYFTCL